MATGFLFDVERLTASRQLDIIVCDPTGRAPLFRNREFVVVSSDMLTSAAEVKKTLTLSDVRAHARGEFNFRFGTHSWAPRGVQFVNLFACRSRAKTRSIAECVRDELSRHISCFEAQTVSRAKVKMVSINLVCTSSTEGSLSKLLSAAPRPDLAIRGAGDEQDGLNGFLSSMLPERTGSDLSPDLRVLPIRSEEYSLAVPNSLLLATRLSLRDLAEKAPQDRSALQNLTIGGEKPYAALVPDDLDWNSIRDLQVLQSMPGFSAIISPAAQG